MFDAGKPELADVAGVTPAMPGAELSTGTRCKRSTGGPQGDLRSRREHLEAARRRLAEETWRRGDGDADAPIRELVGSVARLKSIEWTDMDGESAMASVVELENARRALDSALATGMAHLDRSGSTLSEHGLGAAAWLSHGTKGSRPAAKRTIELGKILGRFERFAEAIRTGQLSSEHAMALHAVSNPRIAHLLEEAETTLLEMALETSFAQFRRNLRIIANTLDEDGAEPDCSDHDELSLSTDSQGCLHLRGRLSGHQAQAVEHALRAEHDRQWRSAHTEHGHTGGGVPSPAVLRARALVEIVRHGLASDPSSTRKPRTEAVIVIEHDATCTDDGEPLDAVTAAVLACDAWCQPLVIDPISNTPLFAGRSTRYATKEQRRALIVRDGGCTFPGCDAPASWCDAHHVIPWEDGGTTDIDNLVLLCRRHHGYAHSNRFTLEAIPIELAAGESPPPSGAIRLVWHTPNGKVDAQHAGDRRRRTAA